MIEILHPARDYARITALRATASGYRYVDGWTSALPELLAIRHPRLAVRRNGGADDFAALAAMAQAAGSLDEISRYVVYPWRRVLVRLPDDEHFHRLRTARNRWLITAAEQRLWSSAPIGIAGLSVGASVLTACSLTGARRFRLAEHDTLGPTNLNRLPASVCDLGEPKLLLAQRRTWEIDPYTEFTTFSNGYRARDAAAFLGRGAGRLAVVVEEMDDLPMKVDIRVRARAARIPVVMATDHGDGAFLDVERYDLEPDAPLFGGRAGDLTADRAALTDPARRLEMVHAIVGAAVSPRTRASLTEVGRTLPTWPQLGTAVGVAGALAAAAGPGAQCGGARTPGGRSGGCR
uniref:ThiF family adenylyltransferase n=1 Tax=Nocardia sp. CC201C TaxID=3044575 RepID=UPI0024A7DCD6